MHEILLDYNHSFQSLAGINDKNIRRIEKRFGVQIIARGNKLRIRGDKRYTEITENLLLQLFELIETGNELNNGMLKFITSAYYDDPTINLKEIFSESIQLTTGKREVLPRSLAQREYVFAMNRFDLVLATGPAGTGKTFF